MGAGILLKEENDRTIEYLNSLPVTRKSIVLSKICCGLIYIMLMTLGIGVFNFVGLSISGDFDRKQYLLLSIVPFFSSIVIFALCLFLSTFTNKTRKMSGLSLGIVFASYFLNIISELGSNTEFLKYFSAFTLADVRNVIIDSAINPVLALLSVIITVALLFLSVVRYDKKELV